MTQIEVLNIAMGLRNDSAATAQLRQGWSRTPNATSGQRSADLELISNDCCQAGTHSGSTKSGL